MQLECTNSEQNIKKIKTNNEKLFLSRLMQRNEGAMADVMGPVLPWITTKAKDHYRLPTGWVGQGRFKREKAGPGFPHLPSLSGVKWGRVSVEMGGKSGLSHEREEFLASSRRGQRSHITQYFGRPCAMRNRSTQNARGTPLRNTMRSPCICISPSQLYRIYELPSVQPNPGFM